MHDVHEPVARQIAAIFYPVVQRGENHLPADLLRRRFVQSARASGL